ncbi:MAG: argininosuccinate lyase, partial [Acidobacteriota bacterium]|nr:argininosuccinate lyase [Acidobacteriota bacterium]
RGVPFREAHEQVGRIVLRAIELGVELDELPLAEMHAISPLVTDDVRDALTIEQTLATKSQTGGTSHARVAEALAAARASLG